MQKCRECKQKLELSGFENDAEGKRVNIYACTNSDCPKKGHQIRVNEEDE